MSTVKFQATRLEGTGKAGILTPDADGYYTMPIGGLNTLNSAGKYYTINGCRELFEESSTFMRRVKNGCLNGEVGHPKRASNMTEDEYITRILTIDESNICCHFSEVWLDEEYGRKNPFFNNPELIAIMGKVKPSGPKGAFLKEMFENPQQNVCFSIRSFTKDYYERGRTYRILDTIATFDLVNEGGIANASKWSSPTLESASETTVTQSQLKRFLANESIAMEDSKAIAMELVASMQKPAVRKPLYTQW